MTYSYFACHYSYPADDAEITRVRPAHREFLKSLLDAGQLVASGPYTDGGGSALILLRLPEGATIDNVEEIMNNDPFTVEGVLGDREIRAWNPVLNVF